MFVLGIDPGLSRCGYGAIAAKGGEVAVIASGTIDTPAYMPVPARLAELRAELRALVADLSPDVVAVERVFFQTNARTAMSVGQASGVALLTAVETGCTVVEYTSNEVKLAVTGDGAASKRQVQEMVARILGMDKTPSPPDVADALALAITHIATAPLRAAVKRAADDPNRRGRPPGADSATRHRFTPDRYFELDMMIKRERRTVAGDES